MSELILDILGLPFGADRQGQVFDEQTDIGLMVGESVPCFYFHGFKERAVNAVGRIGKAIYQGTGMLAGRRGHLFKAVLDGSRAIAQKIYQDASAGLVRVSSDSMAHLVRPYGIVGKPGRVSSWPISGMSLMDASTFDAAINPDAIAQAAIKAQKPGLVVVHRPGVVSARVQLDRQAVIDAQMAIARAAVKAIEPKIQQRIDQLFRAEWAAYVDARIAEELNTPAIRQRLQHQREYTAGLRDTRGF